MKKIVSISFIFVAMIACNTKPQTSVGAKNFSPLPYPIAERGNDFHTYFGDTVPEPYAWLENDTSAATEAWVKAENEVTERYLAQIPFREKLRQRLTRLVDYEKYGTPFVKNGKTYFFKNDGLQNQSVLYEAALPLRGDLGGLVVFDPNTLSDDGTVALKSVDFSRDGKYMSYTISRSGSDWEEIYVMDLATKTVLKDKIEWAKFSSVAWFGSGFYYSAYDAPTAKGKEFSNVNENHKIYYHLIGTEQKSDKLFYANKDFPKRFYHAFTPDDEQAVFIYESGANNGNRLFAKKTKFNDCICRKCGYDDSPNEFYEDGYPTYMICPRCKSEPGYDDDNFIEIASDDNYEYNIVGKIGKRVYVLTNYEAPNYCVMIFDINEPKFDNWYPSLPEKEDEVLVDVQFTRWKEHSSQKPINLMIATYDKNATNKVEIYDMLEKLIWEIKTPTYGSIGISADKNADEIFYSFSSFSFPNTIYKFTVYTGKSEVYIEPKVAGFKPGNYVTEQHFYTSKDGTKVPLYLVYKKGLKKDGATHTLLYGYGGFNITCRPSFSPYRIPFLDNGGVYAIANIRGGGEYGEEWHVAGTKMNKQNVFDDFIAAGEYLISEKFTSKEKLACLGGSNGGLLVGAVVNQRPDLWRVAIPEVGVMDMLRYHKFTIGWNWASDYGTSDDSREMYEYLRVYSPLHNIRNDGTPYPAILVTTADHDDRVVPAHSFKYAAALQAADTGNAPKLIRIDTKAGHGGGKPIAKVIDENVDVYSFIMWNLGVEFK
ncbi:MAG: prolyl oligopeptidase family serine peptidase [Candidatus Symbiothrix sp.]|jgi:prolyl oligopeptidase|nr:prolyl oligopeptidase family serine peptidase [Candidatus Symbiothrix sp.]